MIPSDGNGYYWTDMEIHSHCGTVYTMIIGLMRRAMNLNKTGFSITAAELHELVMPHNDNHRPPAIGNLSTGFHIGLLAGLSVTETFWVSDTIGLVPIKDMNAFVSERDLAGIWPNIIEVESWESMGLIVEAFRWRPKFRRVEEEYDEGCDGRSHRAFSEDAQAFVELLSMFHKVPVTLVNVLPHCIHRAAGWLMGYPPIPRSYNVGRIIPSPSGQVEPLEVDQQTLRETAVVFRRGCGDNYRNCAPAIARLAEALARTGRYRDDDKILDVAIALEQLYQIGRGEINNKLKTRAACFLRTSKEERMRVLKEVSTLYSIRSKIVHGETGQPSPGAKQTGFNKGFNIARESIVKILRDGRPGNWDEVVVGGTGTDGKEFEA